MKICECEKKENGETVFNGDLGLKGGHTSCMIFVCAACSGLRGFPHSNLLIAVKDGNERTQELLEKLSA